MTLIYNIESEKSKRRILRRKTTEAELIVWRILKNRKICGHKFRRQYSIKGFVLDFYCPEAKLAIEIDGGYHLKNESQEYDREREKFIESLGIRFLRFRNDEICENINNVMTQITNYLSPPLLREREVPTRDLFRELPSSDYSRRRGRG